MGLLANRETTNWYNPKWFQAGFHFNIILLVVNDKLVLLINNIAILNVEKRFKDTKLLKNLIAC